MRRDVVTIYVDETPWSEGAGEHEKDDEEMLINMSLGISEGVGIRPRLLSSVSMVIIAIFLSLVSFS